MEEIWSRRGQQRSFAGILQTYRSWPCLYRSLLWLLICGTLITVCIDFVVKFQIEFVLASSLLYGLPRGLVMSPKLVRLCRSRCVVDRTAIGWECHRATLRLTEKIWFIMRSIKNMQKLWTKRNHARRHKTPRRPWRSIFSFMGSDSRVGGQRWGIFSQQIWLVYCGGGSVRFKILMLAILSSRC